MKKDISFALMDAKPDDCGVTASNRFSAARGLYWFCSHYYAGQGDRLYRIFSTLLGYEPGASEDGVSEDDGSIEFYAALENSEIDPDDLNLAIIVAYGKVQP